MRRAHGFADKLGQGVLQGLKKQDESKTRNFASSYRRNFENSLKVTPKEETKSRVSDSYEKWDWFIVDEAQDIQTNHALFIQQLRSLTEHFIVAGDPRQ